MMVEVVVNYKKVMSIHFLLSILFLFNSCNGTNKTISNSSKETQKKEIFQTQISVSNEPKTIVYSEEIISSHLDSIKKTEETPFETVLDSIETFNHNLWNSLLQKYVSSQGNVSYKGFKESEKELDDYLEFLSENTPQDSWTKVEKLAYWINAYNAFTIKLILDNYPVKSIKDISSPWDNRFIKLGNKTYSLNDIEHKILRKMGDPRIHFGIVCASVSCPKLQNTAFESSKIEEQLTSATKEFLADSSRNDLSQNSIKISKIFKWFSSDFKQNGSLIDFLNAYSEITISQNASKRYKDYDWSLNE